MPQVGIQCRDGRHGGNPGTGWKYHLALLHDGRGAGRTQRQQPEAQARLLEVQARAVSGQAIENLDPPGFSVWLAAARPQTLTAAAAPVMVGLTLADRTGHVNAMLGLMTLLAALLIQIGTNLANDYFDFVAGADTAARLGPLRVTQAGLVGPSTVRNAALGVLGLAALIGCYLVSVGGWPIPGNI